MSEERNAAIFHVRAVVDPRLREVFDEWYQDSHLPLVITKLGAAMGWRYWSTTEENVHYALYAFADMRAMDAAMDSPGLADVIADFDRTWPTGVTRMRQLLDCVDALGPDEAALRLDQVPHEASLSKADAAIASLRAADAVP